MAIGTMPNISFVLEDGLKFENNGKYLSEIFLQEQDFLANKKAFSIITKIDEKTKKSVSFFGDLHPNFEGNVVKAMASAKRGYGQINQALKLINYSSQNIKYKNYREDFLVNILRVDRLSDNVIEIYVKSKLLANQTGVGQIFRLHNYHALALESKGQTMAMEGVVVTALAIDKIEGIISGVIVETGGSSSLIKNFKVGEPCVFMGPSGKPTEIPQNETVVLIGGGRGNQPLTALSEVFKANGCKVLFFAGYRDENYIVRRERMQKCCDELIISVENEGSPDAYFQGNVIDSIKNSFCKNKIKIDRVFAIGNDNLMHNVARLRHENIVEEFAQAKYSITSLNSPMQCMMKGVCGQCLQKKKNIDGEFEYFYSCANQDQSMDEVDFEHLHARCEQNSLLEKTTKLWLKTL
jgi:NAD(P)H-flavin reductase